MRKRKMCAALLISSMIPLCSLAQQLENKRVSLKLHNATVKVFFEKLREQTGLNFVYNNEQIKNVPLISIQGENMELKDALNKAFAKTSLVYYIDNNTVTLYQQEPTARRTIHGTVTDADGSPLPGANVKVKGSKTGSITDAEGRYTLSAPVPCELVISFIGMETQTIAYNGQNNVQNVKLNDDSKSIDEVVVNGYFTRKSEGFAGSVTTIKKEELQKIHTGNIFTTISALDAGFKITENNNMGSSPNTLPDFTIRGKGSFQEGSSAPLFVLDGFEVSLQKIYDLDVNRIESITILKDASATILYGSKAANGVVVVETVKPKPGQLRLTYDFKPTIAIADLTDYDLMNAAEKLEYERLAGLYDPYENDLNTTYEREANYYKKYKNILEGVNTDWLAQPVRNAFSHTHSLQIEGGAENVLYSIDGYFDKNNGVMKASGRDRYSLGFSLQYRIKNKIVIRNYATYSNTHAYESPYGSFSDYAKANPYERITLPNGELAPTLSDGRANPLYDASLPNRNKTDNEYFSDELSADWIVGNGWRLMGQFKVEKGNTRTDIYKSPFSSAFMTSVTDFYTGEVTYTPIDINKRGELTLGSGKYLNYTGKITVNYNKLIADKHMLFFGGGAEVSQNESDSYQFTTTGFADDRYSDPAFAIQFKENSRPSSSESTIRSIGALANFNYIYDERFFIDLSGRYDGSSQFGANKRWAPFGSIGAGWNLNKEHFWSPQSVLDVLKLRVSYGITGNQEFEAYQAQTMYQYQTDRLYNSVIPSTLKGYGNTNLKWQNQYTTNIGIDLGMWKNRLAFTVNYYHKLTDGMLANISVAPSLGFPQNMFVSNLGEIENKGWEFTLAGSILRDRENDLEWRMSLQASHNKNTLKKISNALKNLNQQNNASDKFLPGNVYEEGESMTAIKAVPSLGIDPNTGNEIYVKKDGTLTNIWDANDKILCGDTEPKLYGNISTNLYWKRWNLNAIFQYSLGGDLYNSTLSSRVEGANPRDNADRRVLNDRWTTPGKMALYRNIRDYQQTYVSTRFVQRNDYLKFTSLSLSYDVKKECIRNYHLNGLRLSFYANDLFYISTIKQERGTDYPFARSFVFGMNVTI